MRWRVAGRPATTGPYPRPCRPVAGSTALHVASRIRTPGRRPARSPRRHDPASQVGSGVHGISITGQGDRDEMGLCWESRQFVAGLACMPDGTRCLDLSVRFERYERQVAWDMPSGMANRSDAGDLDVIIYSVRNWARLALAGNSAVLLVSVSQGRKQYEQRWGSVS
jgi:hypothetical protein